MTVERQAQALLDLVESDRAQKCEAILSGARAQADRIVREAYRDARARMHAAFREEHERHDLRVRAALANLQTKRRHALQRRAAALLAAAWSRLPEALVGRWQSAPARSAWVGAVVANARALLPPCAWRISHAPDWPTAERDALVAELASTLGATPICEAVAGIGAGLKVSADGNVIDGTLEGLLADRSEIGGRLLQIVESEVPE